MSSSGSAASCDHLSPETNGRRPGTPSPSASSACTCSFENTVTEKISHFATFPPALAERCIKAGTSERGCCAACGAPREREVLRPGGSFHDHGSDATQGQNQGRGQAKRQYIANLSKPRGTVGWSAGCDRNADSTPCVVLDPFSGAGTTGLVALRLGRSYVGIELSPEYVEMSRRRLEGDAPLVNTVAVEEAPEAEQLDLEVPSPATTYRRGYDHQAGGWTLEVHPEGEPAAVGEE